MCPRVLVVSQTVRDVPDGEYELSAWVKTATCKDDGEGALLYGTRSQGEVSRIRFPSAGTGWQRISARVSAKGELRVMIRATPGYVGWIDDIRLSRADDGSEAMTSSESLYLRFMKHWIEAYRNDGRDFLANGFRIKPPHLSCGRTMSGGRLVPAVRSAAYRAADGRRALVLANATEDRQSCSCVWQGRRRKFELEPAEIVIDVAK